MWHVCRSEEKLKAARAALGQAAVHLIRINSIKGDPGAVLGHERIWRAPLPGCLPSGGAGEPPSRPPVPAAVGSLSASLARTDFDAGVHIRWWDLLCWVAYTNGTCRLPIRSGSACTRLEGAGKMSLR